MRQLRLGFCQRRDSHLVVGELLNEVVEAVTVPKIWQDLLGNYWYEGVK